MTLQTVLDDMRKRPGAGEVIPVIDHVTEEQITEFTDCGEAAVNEAVARAKAAFESGVWSQLPGRERAKVMWRIADSDVRGVLPLLRRLVHQAQRQRV